MYVEPRRRISRRALGMWIWGAVIVVVTVVTVVGVVDRQRAADTQTDTYYCTLSGITLLDRGPNTGRLCADLLGY